MILRIIDYLLDMVSTTEEMTISDFHNSTGSQTCAINDPNGNLKFIEESFIDQVATYGQYGITPITASRKTVEYTEYLIRLDNGKTITVADEHIFVVNDTEILTRNLKRGDRLSVRGGSTSIVTDVIELNKSSNMYDLEIGTLDHTYFTNDILSHNSTTIASGFMLHQIVFGEFEKWGILANKGSTSREILSRLKMAFEYLPLWLKPGVSEWNKGKISLDNGCSVIAESTSSDSVRGQSLTGILLDEFAHVDNAGDFFTSVMPVISSGINTKVVIVSTPNGKGNLYHKLWVDSVAAANGFIPYTADWRVVPERTEEWKESEVAELGPVKFKQEYECSFTASMNTLIDLGILDTVPISKPIMELSNTNLLVYNEVEKDHQYFITVDPARGVGLDYSTFHVIDITSIPFKQVATYRSNTINPLFLPNIIVDTATKYNNSFILMELNKGADIAKDIYYDLEYENMLFVGKDKQTGTQKLGAWKDAKLGLLQTNASKMKGCANLKSLLEGTKLELNDGETINELFTFVKTNTSYAADEGKHDDLVMSLVVFAWASSQEYFKDLTSMDFVRSLKDSHLNEDILPFGFIDDYTDDDELEPISQYDSFFMNTI